MNIFGEKYRISIFGESHGPYVGVTLDGVKAGIPLNKRDFSYDLSRRKSGGLGTTPRIESDAPEIISGVFNDFTTGAPVTLLFANSNTHSRDYSLFRDTPRPGQADFAAGKRFNNFNDLRGGGHFSGRLTLALVAAGVIAKKMIEPVQISAKLISLGGIKRVKTADDNDASMPEDWRNILKASIKEGDSLGGIIECTCNGVPAGLGDPFFNSVESLAAHLFFSIPAVKGVEFGAGFKSANLKGSENNDCISDSTGKTITNNAGGINGGITNGNPIVCRVAVKPTSSISKKQLTYNFKTNKMEEFSIPGRHDVCIALRVPVIVESVMAITLVNLMN